jgi:hypothetical protein
MGVDGIVDPTFVALGGRAGDLATNVGAPAESLPSAKQFIADYQAANYAEPFGAYGAVTYDATNVIIDGLAKAVQGGTWSEDTRKTVVSNVQATNLQVWVAQSRSTVRRHHEPVLTVYTVRALLRPIEGSTAASGAELAVREHAYTPAGRASPAPAQSVTDPITTRHLHGSRRGPALQPVPLAGRRGLILDR